MILCNYTGLHPHTHTYMYTHMYAHMHSHTHIHTHTHIHMYTQDHSADCPPPNCTQGYVAMKATAPGDECCAYVCEPCELDMHMVIHACSPVLSTLSSSVSVSLLTNQLSEWRVVLCRRYAVCVSTWIHWREV